MAPLPLSDLVPIYTLQWWTQSQKKRKRTSLRLCQSEKVLGRGKVAGYSWGISEDSQDLVALCKALSIEEKVIFPGFVPMEDLVVFYQGAELFVYPSLYEGFGLPPLEAMISGVPVVSSPVPSVMEVARDSALIFNPEDTTALVAHLSRGLEDVQLRETMQAKGHQAVAPLSWENTARQTLEVYHSVLGIRG